MTPAIRFRVMPASIVAHPGWSSLEPSAALLCFELHVGTIASTTIGIYRAPRVHLELVARADGDELLDALARLHALGFVEFDPEAEVMRLPCWLQDYRPASVRSFSQALSWLTHIPACRARSVHLEQLRLSAGDWGEKYVVAFERSFERLVAAPAASTQLPLVLPLARVG